MLLISRGSVSCVRPSATKKPRIRRKTPSGPARVGSKAQTVRLPKKVAPTFPGNVAEGAVANDFVRTGLNYAGMALLLVGPALLALTGQRTMHKPMSGMPGGPALHRAASTDTSMRISSESGHTEAISEQNIATESSSNDQLVNAAIAPDAVLDTQNTAVFDTENNSNKVESYGYVVGAVDRRELIADAKTAAAQLSSAMGSQKVAESEMKYMVGAVDRRDMFLSAAEMSQMASRLTPAASTSGSQASVEYMVGAVARHGLIPDIVKALASYAEANQAKGEPESVQYMVGAVDKLGMFTNLGKAASNRLPPSRTSTSADEASGDGAVDERSILPNDLGKVFSPRSLSPKYSAGSKHGYSMVGNVDKRAIPREMGKIMMRKMMGQKLAVATVTPEGPSCQILIKAVTSGNTAQMPTFQENRSLLS
eukprot:gene21593-28593_t